MEWMLGAILGALFGWAANQFLPWLWRRVTRRPLLRVFVETDPAMLWAGAPPWVGASFVVPNVEALGRPPSNSCVDWYAWLQGKEALDGGKTELELTLTAGSDLTVVVDGARARIIRRAPQPPWQHVVCAVGGADITPRHINIDLETFDPPSISYVDESAAPVSWPSFSLSKGEAAKFRVIAQAGSADVEWTMELLAIVNGRRRIFGVDLRGKPFRTCGTEGLPLHIWDGSGSWRFASRS